MAEFLFDLEDVTADGQRREIESAKQWARRALLSDPSAPIVVNFSFGKDSLLTALIVAETLDELNDLRPVTLNFFYSGYQKETFLNWFEYVRQNISKRFVFNILKTAPFYRFSVVMLGRGHAPILPIFPRRWCTQYKIKALQQLEKENKNALLFIGARGQESPRRSEDIRKNGIFNGTHWRIIGNVSTNTVWDYLGKNLYKIGISAELLREYYATDPRDGCWFCYAQRYQNPYDIYSAIVLKLREYVGKDYNKELRVDGEKLRTRLYYCRLWFYELLELQRQYNKELLNETDKKYIFELWRIREQLGEMVTKREFLKAYNEGRYTPLYPELFDLTFENKNGRLVYRSYEKM